MKSIEEAWDIIEGLNNDAHNEAWGTWVSADELSESEDENDWETAEEIREQASLEQAEYFRDFYFDLSDEDQELIKYWLEHDESFCDQFSTYFGDEEFINEFSGNKDQ